jgi:hypothetical protein
MKILLLGYLSEKIRGMKKGANQKEKKRCKVGTEKRKALFKAITIPPPKVRKTLPTKDPTALRRQRSNLAKRSPPTDHPAIVDPIIVGLAKRRTEKSRSTKTSRILRKNTTKWFSLWRMEKVNKRLNTL